MNRSQLEHIIRAASEISGDKEIVVIGSQSIHAQLIKLPPIAFQSWEADVYPLNYPERLMTSTLLSGSSLPFMLRTDITLMVSHPILRFCHQAGNSV